MDTCSHNSGPSGLGDKTPSSSGLQSRDDTCTCPGPHTCRAHIRAWDHKIEWNCENLAESLCDIQLPSTYYITDVDLMQIWAEILILSNSDSGTKHNRAGRNIICWCHLFLQQAILFVFTATGLEMSMKKKWGLVLGAWWSIAWWRMKRVFGPLRFLFEKRGNICCDFKIRDKNVN